MNLYILYTLLVTQNNIFCCLSITDDNIFNTFNIAQKLNNIKLQFSLKICLYLTLYKTKYYLNTTFELVNSVLKH